MPGKGSCLESVIVMLSSHYDIMCGCGRPDPVNNFTRKCGYLIILLFVAAQRDVKLQYEKFSMIDKEQQLRYIEIMFIHMIALFK